MALRIEIVDVKYIKPLIMEKYLVTLEFDYIGNNKWVNDTSNKNRVVTLGIYNDFIEACEEGNKRLEYLESKYPLNPKYNIKERFSEDGGIFGTSHTFISNIGYLVTPFNFHAKITTLRYEEVEDVLKDIEKSIHKYKNSI